MNTGELKKLLEQAEQDPRKLAALVSGLPAAVTDRKPAPGKWCIREIVAHLADSEIVFAYRFRQVLAEDKPTFAPIDQDAWAAKLGYMDAAIPELVAQFGLERHHNLRLLRKIARDDLQRSGFHPERGKQVSLEEMIAYWAQHGPNHLKQIEALKGEK